MNKIYRRISLYLHLKLSTVLRVLCNMMSLNGINNFGGINSINFILQIRNLSFRKYKLLAQGLTVNDQSLFLLNEPPIGYWLTPSLLFHLIYQFRMGPQSSCRQGPLLNFPRDLCIWEVVFLVWRYELCPKTRAFAELPQRPTHLRGCISCVKVWAVSTITDLT